MATRRAVRREIDVPDPETRVPVATWREVRAFMVEYDPDGPGMVEWAERETAPPATPERMASEIVWIILCAGKTAQAARTIERKVWKAIDAGTPVVEAYGHRGRAAAIEEVWTSREALHDELATLIHDETALMHWARALPWVGSTTAFQLMKNFGVDVAKPDIWLCRLAGIPDRPAGRVERRFEACMALCRPLAEATGDRIATVDTLLWLACNKGALRVSPQAGPVAFDRRAITARPIHQFGDAADANPAQPLLL